MVGKNSAMGDEAITQRNRVGVSWDKLPFATRPISASEEVLPGNEER